ncbi:MAG: hypothetical protein ACHRXM_33545, partial [Isosphaerales bacterium]
MPGPSGGGAGGSSVFRPIGQPARERARSVSGRVWLPLHGAPLLGLLAPTNPVRRKLRQRWRLAIGGEPVPPPPPPPIA